MVGPKKGRNRVRQARRRLHTARDMTSARWIESAILEGERVVLRPVHPDDGATAFRCIHGRRSILRWLLWGGPRSVEELEESFDCWRNPEGDETERGEYLFAIVDRARREFLGTIGLRFTDHPRMADIGYWLAEHVWNRGYATEAIRLATWFAFRHLRADSMCAWVFLGNDASRRVLEKNGFHLVRTVYDKVERDGKKRDEWYFVLLRQEWDAAVGEWAPAAEEVRSEKGNRAEGRGIPDRPGGPRRP